MLPKHVVTSLNEYWQTELSCVLKASKQSIIVSSRLETEWRERMVIFTRDPLTVICTAGPVLTRFGRDLCARSRSELMMGEIIREVMGPAVRRVEEAQVIAALDPRVKIKPPPATVRQLRRGDAESLHRFCAVLEPAEQRLVVEGCKQNLTGVFEGGELKAVGGFTPRNQAVVDVAVVTDPLYREQGHGSSVLSSLIQTATTRGLIPQLRFHESPGADRLARKMGFERYAVALQAQLDVRVFGGVGAPAARSPRSLSERTGARGR